MTTLTYRPAARTYRLAVSMPSGKLKAIGRTYSTVLECRAAQAVVARAERIAGRREPVAVIRCDFRTRFVAHYLPTL